MRKLIVGLVSLICFQYSFSEKTNSGLTHFSNETNDYSLKYGIFKVGEAHLEFKIDQKCPGGFIQADAQSSGLLKLFKDMHFRYESCMDTLTGFPISDSRILIEDDYVDISTVYYDHSIVTSLLPATITT